MKNLNGDPRDSNLKVLTHTTVKISTIIEQTFHKISFVYKTVKKYVNYFPSLALIIYMLYKYKCYLN